MNDIEDYRTTIFGEYILMSLVPSVKYYLKKFKTFSSYSYFIPNVWNVQIKFILVFIVYLFKSVYKKYKIKSLYFTLPLCYKS